MRCTANGLAQLNQLIYNARMADTGNIKAKPVRNRTENASFASLVLQLWIERQVSREFVKVQLCSAQIARSGRLST